MNPILRVKDDENARERGAGAESGVARSGKREEGAGARWKRHGNARRGENARGGCGERWGCEKRGLESAGGWTDEGVMVERLARGWGRREVFVRERGTQIRRQGPQNERVSCIRFQNVVDCHLQMTRNVIEKAILLRE